MRKDLLFKKNLNKGNFNLTFVLLIQAQASQPSAPHGGYKQLLTRTYYYFLSWKPFNQPLAFSLLGVPVTFVVCVFEYYSYLSSRLDFTIERKNYYEAFCGFPIPFHSFTFYCCG